MFNLRQGIGVHDFFDIKLSKNNGASYCFIYKYKQVPKIVLNTKGVINPLILAHEMGHCIHFYLSMAKQHFYALEASIYVREPLAFMFEALALVFQCNNSDIGDKKALIESYRNSSEFYMGNRKGLGSGANGSYRKYYPLARAVGEALAVNVIIGKVSPDIILECLCSGGHLKIDKLITLAEV